MLLLLLPFFLIILVIYSKLDDDDPGQGGEPNVLGALLPNHMQIMIA